MSDSKGFWGSVAATLQDSQPSVAASAALRGDTNATHPLFDQYKALVAMLRQRWLNVPTKSGRPSRGPKYFAVALCDEEPEDGYGVVSSSDTKGKRWACNTCNGFLRPLWSDGPLPELDTIEQEYADWMAESDKRQIRRW